MFGLAPEQRQGDSLRRQTEFSERYAAEHGLVLDDSLRLQDLGLSAYSGEHRSDKGALGQFLKLVEGGKVEKGSVLLVENLDRLSRQEITKALQQFLDIIVKGIKIVTLIDNREYTEETINANFGELIISLTIMSRAHEESATKSKRLTEAWKEKRKQIDNIKLTAQCPAWLKLNNDKTQFNIIEDRKKTICHIFDMKLAGKGIRSIARELNSTPGFWKPGSTNKRKHGEGWRESYIKKILQNRSVIGEFQLHRMLKDKREPIGEAIPDYFPEVVDKDVFYRVQERFRQNTNKGGKTGKVSNLFSHIAKCGYCGSSMAFIDKGPAPRGGQYLVCDRARRKVIDCCSVSIRYDEFERLILTHCRGLRPKDILTENDDTAITLLKGELDGKAGQLTSIITEIENIVDSVSTTPDKRVRTILEARLVEKIDMQDSLKQQMNDLKQQIDALSRSFEDTQLTLDSVKELLTFLSTAEAKKQIEARLKLRNEIRKLISSINVYPGGRPYYTAVTAKEALKAVLSVTPENEDPEGYAWIKEDLQRRVKSPKDFRLFRINFKSGNMRTIYPMLDEFGTALGFDFDKEKGHTFIKRLGKDGRVIIELYEDSGIRVKHYRRSIGPDGKEVLRKIIDVESTNDQVSAERAFRLIQGALK